MTTTIIGGLGFRFDRSSAFGAGGSSLALLLSLSLVIPWWLVVVAVLREFRQFCLFFFGRCRIEENTHTHTPTRQPSKKPAVRFVPFFLLFFWLDLLKKYQKKKHLKTADTVYPLYAEA